MENKVRLVGHYGSDELIACSAWVSTGRELTDEKRVRIPAMVKSLWKDGHETPFEKGIVHFLVDSEIASHIHILKHRISSANAESARYKELKEDKFYLPQDFKHVLCTKEIVDSNGIVFAYEGETWYDILERTSNVNNMLYHQAVVDVSKMFGRKRAKESARFFKMYNSQIETDLMFNMRSFGNFLRLRRSEHAQKEIHDIADTMLRLVENIEGNPFKACIEAWTNDNRQFTTIERHGPY